MHIANFKVQVQNLSGGIGEYTKCPVTIVENLNVYVRSAGDLQMIKSRRK
jgi:hypothetical protein